MKSPEQPALEVSVDDKIVPRSPRGAYRRGERNGWWVRLTRAVGWELKDPEKRVYTIALAAARGEERIVAVWRYNLKQQKWQVDDIQDMRSGALLSSKDLEGRLGP